MKDSLLVVQVSPYVTKHDGDYQYRIEQPGLAMARHPGVRVINVRTTSPRVYDLARTADVLILHLLHDPDLLPVLAERKRSGRGTVYEISDNFMALPRHISGSFSFGQATPLSLTFQLIRSSDAIQAVGDILLQRYGFLHEHRLRFENHVMTPGPPPRPSGDRIVLGWGGSVGHTEDLRWIAPTVSELLCEREDLRFAFMGNLEQFEEVFGSMPGRNRMHHTPPGSLEDYFRFLETLDMGLAPLLDSPFNLCRSDVKFVEYASRGVLPILSDLGPYREHAEDGVNAVRFRDPVHLKSLVLDLLGDRGRLERIRQNAHAYVSSHRIEEDNSRRRLEAYRRLAKGEKAEARPAERLVRVSQDSDLYEPEAPRAERMTLEAMDQQTEGRRQEALRLWEEAAHEDAAHPLPCLLLGEALARDDSALAEIWALEALRRNPDSLRGLYLLGTLVQRRDHRGAERIFEKAVRLSPDFSLAWRALGLMRQAEGRSDEALGLLDRALQGNPFDAEAAAGLGSLLSEMERHTSAAEAFHVAVGLIPDNPVYTLGLVKALIRCGDRPAAAEACREFLERNPGHADVLKTLEAVVSPLQEERPGASGTKTSSNASRALS